MNVLSPFSPSLLILALLQGFPGVNPATACEDSRRVELAQLHSAEARVICVSPGMMTGFLFDTQPAALELQDHARFVEVLHGRNGISFMPPRDMAPGERLRLTARLGDGASQDVVTFTLVAHPGRATRLVEVYRDRRTRESYQQEVIQEHAKNQRMLEEIDRLRAEIRRRRSLRGAIANQSMGYSGVWVSRIGAIGVDRVKPLPGTISLWSGTCYRTNEAIAVDMWLHNSTSTPWITTGVSISGPNGEEIPGVMLLQEQTLLPDATQQIIVEAAVSPMEAQGHFVLKLWDAESRVFTLSKVVFPYEKTQSSIGMTEQIFQ